MCPDTKKCYVRARLGISLNIKIIKQTSFLVYLEKIVQHLNEGIFSYYDPLRIT